MASPRLLVIDDSLTIRKLVELSFRTRDITLDFATSGTDGTAKAVRSLPDLILLDCVLPDMKGADVCRELSRNQLTAQLPIILMSAKSESAPDLPRNFAQVVGFVGKPFTTDEIVSRVTSALGDRAAASEGGASSSEASIDKIATPGFTQAQQQAAAKALFKSLRERFAEIPNLYPQLGKNRADVFFAKKLLTPAMLSELLEGLLPQFRERLQAELQPLPPPPQPERVDEEVLCDARVSVLSPLMVFEQLAATSRTAEVVVTQDGGLRSWIYLKQGEIVLATTNDPVEYGRGAAIDWTSVPAVSYTHLTLPTILRV